MGDAAKCGAGEEEEEGGIGVGGEGGGFQCLKSVAKVEIPKGRLLDIFQGYYYTIED